MKHRYVIEDGCYAYYENDVQLGSIFEVAILFDRRRGAVLMQGDPRLLIPQYNKLQIALARDRANPLAQEHSEALTVISGRLDVDEVNKALEVPGYISRFYEKLEAQAMSKAQEILSRIAATA